MEVLQLHDKFSEEIIGSILLTDNGSIDLIQDCWDEYQKACNSESEIEADIYDFVNTYRYRVSMEIITINFYQPS